jgi:hypothetical protein
VSDLAARLQLLVDKDEIRDVVYRYCRGVDRGDGPLLSSVYHADAFDDHAGMTFTGETVGEGLTGAMLELMTMTSHHITTLLIEVEGDRAGSEAYYIGIHRPHAGSADVRMMSCGRYLDTLERRDGSWRILQRLVAVDMCRTFAIDDEVDFGPWLARRDHDDPSYAVLGT